jgi:hypothetical protein
MRDDKGRFIKGLHSHPETEFKKGQHWRSKKPFWDKDWCIENYCDKKRSCSEIAAEFGVSDAAILHWLKKHGIDRREITETRKIKKWGLSGVDNPMWNKRGELNPHWLGGITPDRQLFYTSQEWKTACSKTWKRDEATCKRCGLYKDDSPDMPFHIHHIKSFVDKKLRADIDNLVLLCEVCHHFVHSKENKDNEFIQKI